MPTTPARARKKLESGRAKCIRREPFTIKLTYESGEAAQPLCLGVDTGSDKLGSAVVDEDNNVYYMSEVQVRNDIAEKMKQRSKYRRNRRNRKTRYRKPRWNNRKNSIRKDRFSPTMRSKIESHVKEVNFVKSILPIAEVIVETGTFDPHALKNPDVLKNKWLYQRGTNYGYANTRAFVLHRDEHVCQHCKGKSKDNRLEVHHIQFKSEQGSDDVENLITLCKNCHNEVHKLVIKLNVKGKVKGMLKHATQMNSIRVQLLRIVNCRKTFGYITKEHVWAMELTKEHYNDAIAIACLNNIERDGSVDLAFKTDRVIYKKCVPYRDMQKNKGVRNEQHIPTGKIQGFRKFDKVLYNSKDYFIKGRMSTGYAILMDITGKEVKLKPIPKFTKMKRLEARTSWIIQVRTILKTA